MSFVRGTTYALFDLFVCVGCPRMIRKTPLANILVDLLQLRIPVAALFAVSVGFYVGLCRRPGNGSSLCAALSAALMVVRSARLYLLL